MSTEYRLDDLAAERDEANARADATIRMANEANARLRAILLSALDLEDDGKTSLTAYVLATVAERDETRAEVERLRHGADVVLAALAYVHAPDGTDEVEQYWWELKNAVGNYQRSTGGDSDGTS